MPRTRLAVGRQKFVYPHLFQKLTAGLCRLMGDGSWISFPRSPLPRAGRVVPTRTPIDRNAFFGGVLLFIGPERIQKRPIFGTQFRTRTRKISPKTTTFGELSPSNPAAIHS